MATGKDRETGYDPPQDTEDRLLAALENEDFNCVHCAHFIDPEEENCKAFPAPDSIPEDIIGGAVAHTKPMFDQKNKLVFKKSNKPPKEMYV